MFITLYRPFLSGSAVAKRPALTMEAAVHMLQILSSDDFSGLVQACEELELAIQEDILDTPTPEQLVELDVIYAAHMLAYVLNGALNEARFLWKRTPPCVQELAQAAGAHEVLAAKWRRQHGEFFNQLQTIPWDARLARLAKEVVVRQRALLLDKVGEAYQVVGTEHVASMLGADAKVAWEMSTQRGWDAEDGLLKPMVPAMVTDDALAQMGEVQLEKLAEYVAYLEQPQCNM